VAGVDGCRPGWVVATVALEGGGPYDVRTLTDLEPLLRDIDTGRLRAIAIDIPVGLPRAGPRQADIETRRRLGPRRNSVFPAPARAVLGAADYAEACARSRAATGKAISKQLFNILPKIAEVDALVTPVRQARLAEMCPEWSLAVLAGAPMEQTKRTAAGRAARLSVLASAFDESELERHVCHPPAGAQADDVLDAFAGAWTARRLVVGTALRVGGELDDRGLRMEVVA
jgi:predicted RNase H-like nuclease